METTVFDRHFETVDELRPAFYDLTLEQYRMLTEVTFAVLRHWIHDETENQEATTALVDKLAAFVAELVTFGGVSRGVDLAWHIARHDSLGLGRLPLVGRFFSGG